MKKLVLLLLPLLALAACDEPYNQDGSLTKGGCLTATQELAGTQTYWIHDYCYVKVDDVYVSANKYINLKQKQALGK